MHLVYENDKKLANSHKNISCFRPYQQYSNLNNIENIKK
jgi:hypothetical protein